MKATWQPDASAPDLIDLLEFEFERTEGYYPQPRPSVKMLATGRWAVMSGLEDLPRHLERASAATATTSSPGGQAPDYAHKLGLAVKSLLAPAEDPDLPDLMTYFGVLFALFLMPPLAFLLAWVPRDLWRWIFREKAR